MALDPDDVEHWLGQELVPAFLERDIVDVIEHALLDQVGELLGGIELGRHRRVAADDAVDRHRARLVGAGDGGVDPTPPAAR
jgi:hypothetical protein